MYPMVSIIVPVYQAEAYLDECIYSIVSQTYRNIEIILVDDGSVDNSLAICNKWAQKDDRIVLLRQKNAGVSAARNNGIINCKGDFIVFIDSDDYIHSNMVNRMIESSGRSCTVAVSYDREGKLQDTNSLSQSIDYYRLITCRGGSYVWGVLYDAQIIRNKRLLFDTTLNNLEDVVWNSLYYLEQPGIIYIDEKLYCYRNTPNSITSKCNDSLWQIESWIKGYFSVLKKIDKSNYNNKNRKIIRKMLISYINNIHAEMHHYNYSYKNAAKFVYPKMNKGVYRQESKMIYFFRRHFPLGMFGGYSLAFAVKRFIKSMSIRN